MRVGKLEFAPGLWPSVVTLVLLGLLMSLGFWQLDRAEQKRALLAGYNSDANETVIRLDAGLGSYADFNYQFASVSGRYDPRRQFLLDNRTHLGRAGYHVLTPLILSEQAAVLVNRGWVPLGRSRDELPDPIVDREFRTVLGRVKVPLSDTFMLGEEESRSAWPYRIQRVNTERLGAELGYPLLPVVVLLDPDQPDGFVRDWKPLRYGPERNVGYAVQWFGLAAALLVIYLVVNTRTLK
jgi:surfeit locus 1 family protein